MAFRTWGRLLLTALAVSVLAGAGQLGIAYGFGIVRLNGDFLGGSVNRWPAQLVWVAWFAAVAAVAGAVLTERFARWDGLPGGAGEQVAVAGAAALGAIVVAPLCMQPARAAELGGTVEPVWAVAICATLGAAVGAGAAVAVLLRPPLGWNIALTAAAVWLLALVSAAPSVASAGPLLTVRLGVLEPSWLDPGAAQRLAMLIMPTVALLAGAAVGALARRRGHLPLVGGVAGAAGPVLLAFAYLTAGPGNAADRYQLAPYYGALIAVAAGALGSAATTVLHRPLAGSEATAIVPTDILQPLPASPAIPGDRGWAAGPESTPSEAAAEGTAGAPDRPRAGGAGASATGALAATPAHWDWPAPSGITPAPRPARGSAPEPARDLGAGQQAVDPAAPADQQVLADPIPADQQAPVAGGETAGAPGPEAASSPAGDETIASRDAGDLARHLPVPGLLPPGRRTSAIDVLAADRPAPHRPAESTPAPASATTTEVPSDRVPALRPDVAAPVSSDPSSLPEGTPVAPERGAPLVAGRTTSSTVPSGDGPTGRTPARTDEPEAAPGPVARQSAERRPRRQPPPTHNSAGTSPGRATQAGVDPAEPEPAGVNPDGAGSERAEPAGVDPTVPARARRGRADTRKGATVRPATAAPADDAAEPASTDRRSGGRSGRGRKVRTGPATATAPADVSPARATPAEAAPAVMAPARGTPAEAAAEAAAGPRSTAPGAGVPEDPAPRPAGDLAPGDPAVDRAPAYGERAGATPDAGGSRRADSYFFAADAASEHPDGVDAPASPLPRLPIFEDVTDRPTSLLPAWPVASTPSRPVAPSAPVVPGPARLAAPPDTTGPDATGPDGSGGGPDATAGGSSATAGTPDRTIAATGTGDATSRPAEQARTEAAPRPRHRALPDLSRGARWDAFANARQVTRAVPNATQASGRHADPGPGATGPGNGQSKLRRGLFRRNRAKDGRPGEAGREPEPLAAQDEEYVDWVAGLASDADGEGFGSLRAGRHHRD